MLHSTCFLHFLFSVFLVVMLVSFTLYFDVAFVIFAWSSNVVNISICVRITEYGYPSISDQHMKRHTKHETVSVIDGKRPFGRSRHRQQGNVTRNKIGGTDWILLAVVNTVMIHTVPQNAGSFLTGCGTVSFLGMSLFHGVSKMCAEGILVDNVFMKIV